MSWVMYKKTDLWQVITHGLAGQTPSLLLSKVNFWNLVVGFMSEAAIIIAVKWVGSCSSICGGVDLNLLS
ncbi:hypothetical protein L6452_35834 [Arctium lappa]|uniref:Uncharacterized protein n=1 Tax=Arctium lappa TaxID=4217 RepID=A0ACB8Y925_ARCLA|nr:hypothetical protein L6452_35834 [Arctium lappa]